LLVFIQLRIMKTAKYTEKEKIILASFVREMGGEIENKKTDATSVQKKQDAWEKIAAHYNSQPEVATARTSKQLKKLWANLKQK
jgi:fatty acid-binding protein DegV